MLSSPANLFVVFKSCDDENENEMMKFELSAPQTKRVGNCIVNKTLIIVTQVIC